MNDDPIRVVVIAENPLARAGLRTMLTQQADCDVVGQLGTDSNNLLEQLEPFEADVVVWDIDWDTDLTMLAAVCDSEYPVLTLVADDSLAETVWGIAISGLLSRDASVDALVQGLQTILLNMLVIDPQFRDVITSASSAPAPLANPLTDREVEVLQLLAQGLSNKGIGYALGISDHTVKFHVNAIMTKLNAQSRTEAAVRATQLGIVSL